MPTEEELTAIWKQSTKQASSDLKECTSLRKRWDLTRSLFNQAEEQITVCSENPNEKVRGTVITMLNTAHQLSLWQFLIAIKDDTDEIQELIKKNEQGITAGNLNEICERVDMASDVMIEAMDYFNYSLFTVCGRPGLVMRKLVLLVLIAGSPKKLARKYWKGMARIKQKLEKLKELEVCRDPQMLDKVEHSIKGISRVHDLGAADFVNAFGTKCEKYWKSETQRQERTTL